MFHRVPVNSLIKEIIMFKDNPFWYILYNMLFTTQSTQSVYYDKL